ncbi:MAG: hypothetical protein GWN00_00725 [Aliifodinibius sp.]|nr:hypothetical protein [Fodinibius sp.]NIV09841.1 hypothetical protein [Fodinibius sp.]NIY23386.1 hypothetical protein [Fodinibius sp.]
MYKHTGNKLYRQLAERITQNVYWTQVTEGDLKGATHERICDPWLARPDGGPAFNSMGTIYMSEQSLDLLLQIIEMTRMGDEIYFGDYILNKVYPDGDCLYNQDVTHAEIVNLHVLPSNGSVSVMVKKWNKTEKVWVEENAPEENISVFHEVGSLDPGHWYMITIDGQKSGKYQADTNGVVRFPFSGNIKETRTYSVVKE